MTLRTSLLITGDSSIAQKAIGDLNKTMVALGYGTKETAATTERLRQVEREAAAAVREMAQAEADATRKHYDAQRAAQAEATTLAHVAAESSRVAAGAKTVADHLGKSSKAANDNAGALASHAFAVRNLGQQFGDMAVMIQGGISPARAFATQAGQMGYAMSEMGGKAGAVGRFLVGPWGIALTVGAAALAPLVEGLFKSGEAADTAKTAIGDLATYVGDIGNFFDRATGKVKETNAALIQFAILSAKKENVDLRNAQRSAQKAGDESLAESVRRSGSSGFARSGIGDVPQPAVNTDVQDTIRSRRNVDARLQAIAAGNSSNAAIAGRILEAVMNHKRVQRPVSS